MVEGNAELYVWGAVGAGISAPASDGGFDVVGAAGGEGYGLGDGVAAAGGAVGAIAVGRFR